MPNNLFFIVYLYACPWKNKTTKIQLITIFFFYLEFILKYRFSFVLSLFVFTFSFAVDAKNCQEVRLGLDIGSGSTKMMVAKIDVCQKKIIEVLHSESRSVQYNEDLEKSIDGKLSQVVIERGQEAINQMVAKGFTFKPKKSYGVATSVFRKAKNGAEIIRNFSKKMKINLDVISQTQEAQLGYLSVIALLDDKALNEKNIVVWDIGGGSMQMFSMGKDNLPKMYLGDLASVTFKNMVIEVIQSKNVAEINSPNPIGEHRLQAVALARSYARLHVPADLKSEIKERQVIGVGGVHTQSIKNQLGLKELKYTLENLDEAAKKQSQKSDSDLVGDYRNTDVTNLLLVQGFMEALGVKDIKIVNATLLQGVLLK